MQAQHMRVQVVSGTDSIRMEERTAGFDENR